MSSHDGAPHSAIVQVRYEVHERMPDGRVHGVSKSKGSVALEIRGGCRVECEAKLRRFLDGIKQENLDEVDLQA